MFKTFVALVALVSITHIFASNVLLEISLLPADAAKNFHYVVDCGRQVMKEHCYWPLVSDLNNVLSHRPVAVKFMSDDALLDMWFDFLSMFQGKIFIGTADSCHPDFTLN